MGAKHFVGLLACILLSSNALAQQAQLVSALINGCGTSDGDGEYIFVYSGGTTFTANTTTINVSYGTSSPAGTTITDSFDDNSTSAVTNYVSSLNSQLGACTNISFTVATSGTSIPAGSHVLIVNGPTPDVIDFSTLCNSLTSTLTIYVMISNDVSWTSSGTFANNVSANRFFTSAINSNTVTVSYINSGWISNTNGNYVHFDEDLTTNYGNYSGCNPGDTNVLPVTLIGFSGQATSDGQVELLWQTADEQNNSHFTIQRSKDADLWEEIGMVPGHINSETIQHYKYTDQNVPTGLIFYRLKQNDLNGDFEYSEIISVMNSGGRTLKIYPNPAKDFLIVECGDLIERIMLVNPQGKVFRLNNRSQMNNEFDLQKVTKGLYKVIIETKDTQLIRSLIIDR